VFCYNRKYGPRCKKLSSIKKADFLREQSRDLLNAPAASDIILLKNTSEALSVVAYGLTWQNCDNIIIANQKFPSNQLHRMGIFAKPRCYNTIQAKPRYSRQWKSADLAKIGTFCRDNNVNCRTTRAIGVGTIWLG